MSAIQIELPDNVQLRERFRIAEEDYPVASRIIRETVEAELIKSIDVMLNGGKAEREL